MQLSGINWGSPVESPDFRANQVHVFAASLDDAISRIKDWECLLEGDELRRAARFHMPLARKRYICGRGILRQLLGHCTASQPQCIRFLIGSNGKPELVQDCELPRLHFNLSHSGGMALYAFTRVCPLGVDLEQIKPLDFLDDLADFIMTSNEKSAWAQMPVNQRLASFYRLWTLKEAVLKAAGVGISEHLQEITVSFTPESPPTLQHALPLFCPPREWTMADLQPISGFSAALAMPERNIHLHCWRFGS